MQTAPPVSGDDLYRIVLGNAPEFVVFTTDLRGLISSWNESGLRMLGYGETEMLGRAAECLFDADDSGSHAARNGDDGRRHCVHRDGSVLSFAEFVAPVRAADGSPHGFAHVLRRADRVSELEHTVNSLMDQVEETERAVSRQLIETHHCVKDSLHMAAALVDLTAACGEIVPRERVKRLNRNIQALASIHDLATRRAAEDPSLCYVSAAAVAEILAPVLQEAVGARGIQFDVDCVRLSLKTAGAISVVLQELVSNAARRGDGDIEVAVKEAHGRLRLSVGHERPAPMGSAARPDLTRADMELLDALVRIDLGGTIQFEEPGGREQVSISIPAARYGEAAY